MGRRRAFAARRRSASFQHDRAGRKRHRPEGPSTRRQTSRSRLAPATLRAMTDLDDVLATIDTWGADHAAAVVIGPAGVLAGRGEAGHRFRWASVTKLATAWCVLIAADRGLLDLDEAAGPPGSTVRHLLAHASGLPFEGQATLAAPGTRRIYSNPGFDALGALVGERDGRPFEAVLGEWVLAPLGMDDTRLEERPSQGLHGPVGDLAALAAELLQPTLVGAGDGPGGDHGRVPGSRRRGARRRPVRPVRLGPRSRTARRQDAALDGRSEQPGDVRALRRRRDIPVDRSRGASWGWSC